MRALVQRVSSASVSVGGERMAEIGPGLLVLLGVGEGDTAEVAERLAGKVRKLRIFDDEPRTTFEADHRPGRKVGTGGCLLFGTRALGVKSHVDR